MRQEAIAIAEDADVVFANRGQISVDVRAGNHTTARAAGEIEDVFASTAGLSDVYGVFQRLGDSGQGVGGDTNAILSNDGAISVTALAEVELEAIAEADASARARSASVSDLFGLFQVFADVDGDASGVVSNSGTLDVSAEARSRLRLEAGDTADSGSMSSLSVSDLYGIHQRMVDVGATGSSEQASLLADNTGSILVSGLADAEGWVKAGVDASLDASSATVSDVYGIYQALSNIDGDADITASNSGTLEVVGEVRAALTAEAGQDVDSVSGLDVAVSDLYGIHQQVDDISGDAVLEATNDGAIRVRGDVESAAHGLAGGDAYVESDTVEADDFYGVWQGVDAVAGDAQLEARNVGSIDVLGRAASRAIGEAGGDAPVLASDASVSDLYGIKQDIEGVEQDLVALALNEGSITVAGNAEVLGAAEAGGDVSIEASSVSVTDLYGIRQYARDSEGDAGLVALNEGTLSVLGQAENRVEGTASGQAFADVASATVNDLYGVYQRVGSVLTSIEGDATLVAMNAGVIDIRAAAETFARVETAGEATDIEVSSASASSMAGIYQRAQDVGGSAELVAVNEGTIAIDGRAYVTGGVVAGSVSYASADSANVSALTGIHQSIDQAGGDALLVADNSGDIRITGTSRQVLDVEADGSVDDATGSSASVSEVFGILQYVDDAADATFVAVNDGVIDLRALGTASVTALAGSHAEATDVEIELSDLVGIHQELGSESDSLDMTAVNSGVIAIDAEGVVKSSVTAGDDGVAEASSVAVSSMYGLYQQFASTFVSPVETGAREALAFNEGSISLSAVGGSSVTARANGDAEATLSSVSVSSVGGIVQAFDGTAASAADTAINVGTIDIHGEAWSKATAEAPGNASVSGSSVDVSELFGIHQFVDDVDDEATISALNEGSIEVRGQARLDMLARAGGMASVEGTSVSVSALFGIKQSAWGAADGLELALENSGVIEVEGVADSRALAEGASGEASVSAFATDVHGLFQEVLPGGDATLTLANTGTLLVAAEAFAEAEAPGSATATARATDIYGIRQEASGRDSSTFSVSNSGLVVVSAWAEANAQNSDAVAQAVGLGQQASSSSPTVSEITNQGQIIVSASTSDGEAYASALRLDVEGVQGFIRNQGASSVLSAYAQGTADGWVNVLDIGDEVEFDEEFEILNDSGWMTAEWSEDGGDTLRRGTLIDLSVATGSSVFMDWRGSEADGRLVGDITLREDDRIEVSEGVTRLSGVVNPAESARNGSLSLLDGGGLELVLHEQDGGSDLNLRSYEQEADSTLSIEMAAGDETVEAGGQSLSVSQVNADEVALDGTLELRATSGLYADLTTYRDFVLTDDGSGEWDTVVFESALLDVDVVYRDGFNPEWTAVDLQVERFAFDAADDLTGNQRSVAESLEVTYPSLQAGGGSDAYGALVGELFTLDGEAYRQALGQLDGSIYAQGLRSITGSLHHFEQRPHSAWTPRRCLARQWAIRVRTGSGGRGGLAAGDRDARRHRWR